MDRQKRLGEDTIIKASQARSNQPDAGGPSVPPPLPSPKEQSVHTLAVRRWLS